ncbi:MAG: GNAT family N-acetyltransferase [Actinomycetota bacterium]|nr:GNAT family N-acetyltransferase [Rubrobacter sp.]MDQ3506877.1 GNAT family N-acetyltransferase [Actinomycetota bacterium]
MADSRAELRPMAARDVGRTTRAAAEVGWGGQRRQISFFQNHPDCVGSVAESGGGIVGASFGAANGRVGWLGLIFVSPAFRGLGLGSALARAAMDSLESLGCRSLVLVATEMGRPLYEKLGFGVETNYRGFAGPGAASDDIEGFRRVSSENFEEVLRLDRRVTGGDRARLLGAMPRGWMLAGEEGEVRAHYFAAPWGGGPAIASDFEAGKKIVDLRRSIAGPEGSVRAWLTDENVRGRGYMGEIGFEEFRVSPRMVYGERVEWEPEGLWGIFSLAKG